MGIIDIEQLYEIDRTRFPEKSYYFLRNGREILDIAGEEFDVTDVTDYGLAVLLDLTLSYLYNPEYRLKTFPDFIKKCIFDVRYSPVSINLSEVDTHSIFDALGIPYTPIVHYGGLFWLKIKDFFQNIYNKIEKYISQSKAEWKDDWRKITEWEKTIYIDLGVLGKYELFTITGEGVAWVVGITTIIGLIAILGYSGYIYSISYITEKGKIKARD